jgi:hypothetical protein
MVITGKFKGRLAPLAGRIGENTGKMLAEQLPAAIQQGRLASGLKQFQNNAKNLSPLEQATELFSIPGITPQMVQTIPQILQQQNFGQALAERGKQQEPPNPFPQRETSGEQKSGGITTSTGVEATRKPFIPPTYDQILDEAGQEYTKNPQLYKNDPQNAINAVTQKYGLEKDRNEAFQRQRQNEQQIQNTIKESLKTQRESLGAKVPGNVYSDIEDKAINSVLPKSEGGEGLTEQESAKKYGKELDKRSRDYEAIKSIGNFSALARSAKENRQEIRTLREDFKKENDLENFADTLIKEQQISPSVAYHEAYPISDIEELNKFVNKLPNIKGKLTFSIGFPERGEPIVDPIAATKMISERLAKEMGKDGSPLSIAEELRIKGYDPDIWMEYVRKNRNKLDLSERQGRELSKPRNFINTLNDLWLFGLTGNDKAME